jgi:serine/threonine protein phosphatase 1
MPASPDCAIGEIHGELERLKDLHRQVLGYLADVFPAMPVPFVQLGDLIDSGPDSRGVIDYLIAFEHKAHPRPVTLRGNHEPAALRASANTGLRP